MNLRLQMMVYRGKQGSVCLIQQAEGSNDPFQPGIGSKGKKD